LVTLHSWRMTPLEEATAELAGTEVKFWMFRFERDVEATECWKSQRGGSAKDYKDVVLLEECASGSYLSDRSDLHETYVGVVVVEDS
jgi:hypothetical protein